jgi:hypothetical protein
MAAIQPANRENVVSLSEVRAGRHLSSLPLSLDMEFSESERGSAPIGRTFWFTIMMSMALWAVIAGAIWFV